MLRALNRALRAEQQGSQASSASVQPQGQSNTEKVLQVMEIVLSEASRLPQEQYTVRGRVITIGTCLYISHHIECILLLQ